MRSGNNLNRSKRAGKRAVKIYGWRFNCAQSVILAVSKELKIKKPEELIRSTGVFTGGIGYKGCICGALAGAVLMIGYLRKSGEKEAGEFYKLFKKEFKTSCCKGLRRGMEFEHPELNKHCAEITGRTTEMLVDYLEEKGI